MRNVFLACMVVAGVVGAGSRETAAQSVVFQNPTWSLGVGVSPGAVDPTFWAVGPDPASGVSIVDDFSVTSPTGVAGADVRINAQPGFPAPGAVRWAIYSATGTGSQMRPGSLIASGLPAVQSELESVSLPFGTSKDIRISFGQIVDLAPGTTYYFGILAPVPQPYGLGWNLGLARAPGPGGSQPLWLFNRGVSGNPGFWEAYPSTTVNDLDGTPFLAGQVAFSLWIPSPMSGWVLVVACAWSSRRKRDDALQAQLERRRA